MIVNITLLQNFRKKVAGVCYITKYARNLTTVSHGWTILINQTTIPDSLRVTKLRLFCTISDG